MRTVFAILLSSLLMWVQGTAGLASASAKAAGLAPCKCCTCTARACCPAPTAPTPRPASPLMRAAARAETPAAPQRSLPLDARVPLVTLAAASFAPPLSVPPVPVPSFVRHCALLL